MLETDSGWTRGQYTLFRFLVGAALVVWAAVQPLWVAMAGIALSLLIASGWQGRTAAVVFIGLVGAYGSHQVRAVFWALLLIVAVMPPVSITWLRRGPEEVESHWRVPALWWYVGLGCLAALQAQQGTLVWFALLLPVLLTPALVRPSRSDTAMVFYDGGCAICHLAVRFLISEDRTGNAFRFAALGGAKFRKLVPENARSGLPDSMVLRTPDGRLLTKGDAVLEAGPRLGGYWRVLAALAALVPKGWRDGAYDALARRRKQLLGPPPDACPVMSEELRRRVDD